MGNRIGLVTAASVLIAIGACTTTSTEGTPFADEYCGILRRCCDGLGLGASLDCANRVGVRTERVSDRAKEACLSELRAARDQATFCKSDDALTPACATVFASASTFGDVPPGGACNGTNCAPSDDGAVACVATAGGAKVCEVLVAGVEGSAPCVATRSGIATFFVEAQPPPPGGRAYACDLGKGLFCDGAKCARVESVGGPCAGQHTGECAEGTWCTPTRTCEPRLAVGDDCTNLRQYACATDAKCDATTRKCIALTALGGACTENLECSTKRCKDRVCVVPGPQTQGIANACAP